MNSGSGSPNLLKGLDYSVAQQCIHCGMCLPTCPTYDITKQERNSPRGRIALMRAIADDKLETTKAFADEIYYCLGCLACKTACPAGVDYPHLFEVARAEAERAGVKATPARSFIRWSLLKVLFGNAALLHLAGRLLYLYRALGLHKIAVSISGILPTRLRDLLLLTPVARAKFSTQLIREKERPDAAKYKVGLLTGCVQDILYSEINRATADVLLAANCEVITPRGQLCCGSLHAHNGELELSKEFSRKLIDQFDLNSLDAIITNAGGCGSHLKEYARLLSGDPKYAEKARVWSSKLKDINEWLMEIGFDRQLQSLSANPQKLTYHDSCHLAHGQSIVKQPRALLRALPGVELVELPEASWCCGSAGVYNITQPETAEQLGDRKLANILKTGCTTVVTANPGCLLQIQKRAEARGVNLQVLHPVQVLANYIRGCEAGTTSAFTNPN